MAGASGRARSSISTPVLVSVNYPGDTSSAGGSARLSHVVAIGEPAYKNREGVYIWRDPEAKWHLLRVLKLTIPVTGMITTAGRISTGQGEHLTITGAEKAAVNLNDPVDQITFTTTGEFLEFDLLLGGVCDPGRIYLGTRATNPKHMPFRLVNTPLRQEGPKASGAPGWQGLSPVPARDAPPGSGSGRGPGGRK